MTHARFADACSALRAHYAVCGRCGGNDTTLCVMGLHLWDKVAAAFVEMIRVCAPWHSKKYKGRDRVDVLIRKMERAFRRVKD